MKYRVLISEKQNGYVEVDAETKEIAKKKALEEYDKGNICWTKSEIAEVKLEKNSLQIDYSNPIEYKLKKEENTTYIILEENKNCALIKRFISDITNDPSPYIIAYGLEKKPDNLIEWDRGSYCSNLKEAVEEYSDYIKSLEKDPTLIGEIDYISPSGKIGYTNKYFDISDFKKEIDDCLYYGVPIDVRDYSNQGIYSNAMADMYGYDEAQEKWEQEQKNFNPSEQYDFEEDDEMEI